MAVGPGAEAVAAGLAVALLLYALLYHNCLRGTRCRNAASLRGKTVLLTGGNRGIGKATALDLARRGARVVLACRDPARGEAAAAELRRASGGGQVRCMSLDLASLRSVRAFARAFLSSEPRLDVLINNAGEPPGPLPADPPPPGAAQALRPQPGGGGGLAGPPVGESGRREHPQARGRSPADLPLLLRQQAGQHPLRPRAGQPPGRDPRHLLRPPPRGCEYGPLSPHPGLAEALLPPRRVALLPRRCGRSADVHLLFHPGRHRGVQRALLCRLPGPRTQTARPG
ncbi:dehydrogenase/reductase SDR family member 13 isoform X2 [Pogona vitticeps]